MLVGLALPAWSQTAAPGKWTADWEVLNRHKVPDWILDAKIGVQYVGEPMDLNDFNGWLWGRSAWRHRENGAPPPTAHELLWKDKFTFRGGLPRVFEHNPIKDTDAVLARYKDLGARFVVSMREAAYPGTEGLWMDQREIASARKLGMKVGVHYNLIRRDGVPSIGDAGYVDWTQTRMRKAVEEADADFVFFDGSQFAPSGYFKTDEFVAWYYNWADRKGKQVWVNDDLGNDRQETGEYGDLVDYESCTVEGISPRPWINWDILRNDWTCWVNEFGIHRLNGKKWALGVQAASPTDPRFSGRRFERRSVAGADGQHWPILEKHGGDRSLAESEWRVDLWHSTVWQGGRARRAHSRCGGQAEEWSSVVVAVPGGNEDHRKERAAVLHTQGK